MEDGTRFLIKVSKGSEGKYLRLDAKDDLKFLAYEGDLVWEPDHAGPVEITHQNLFETTGALVCDAEGWF